MPGILWCVLSRPMLSGRQEALEMNGCLQFFPVSEIARTSPCCLNALPRLLLQQRGEHGYCHSVKKPLCPAVQQCHKGQNRSLGDASLQGQCFQKAHRQPKIILSIRAITTILQQLEEFAFILDTAFPKDAFDQLYCHVPWLTGEIREETFSWNLQIPMARSSEELHLERWKDWKD